MLRVGQGKCLLYVMVFVAVCSIVFWYYIGYKLQIAEIIINFISTIIGGYLLYECGSFKVLNGLLTELCLDVVNPEPLDHIDVGGEEPEGLSSNNIRALSQC